MKITICRKAHFNAAHKLYNPSLSNEENFEIFGKCSYENFHGHNYELIVKILGDIDPKTGMVLDLSILKKIKSKILIIIICWVPESLFGFVGKFLQL